MLLDSERAFSIGKTVSGGLKVLRGTNMLEVTSEENVRRCIKAQEVLSVDLLRVQYIEKDNKRLNFQHILKTSPYIIQIFV